MWSWPFGTWCSVDPAVMGGELGWISLEGSSNQMCSVLSFFFIFPPGLAEPAPADLAPWLLLLSPDLLPRSDHICNRHPSYMSSSDHSQISICITFSTFPRCDTCTHLCLISHLELFCYLISYSFPHLLQNIQT